HGVINLPLAASRCRSDRGLFACRCEFESRYRNRANKHSRSVGWSNAHYFHTPRRTSVSDNRITIAMNDVVTSYEFDDLRSSLSGEHPRDERQGKGKPVRTVEEILRRVQRELCLIKLCWPDVSTITEDLYARSLPDSYRCVSDKERLLLWYAENFRRQIHAKYANRRPLLLACENECRVQKFVSTNMKRSTLPYPELYTWRGCVKFISDHIEYQPLDEAFTMVSQQTF
ncbi:dynein regulatory complex subunit 7, partial [Temnothorax longispinosus]|uniref:dynein regulatory complex subunit 7 n=1 Tax=Temnothorax longispinosus TaxID=300112 RepID=UPI003A9903A6